MYVIAISDKGIVIANIMAVGILVFCPITV